MMVEERGCGRGGGACRIGGQEQQEEGEGGPGARGRGSGDDGGGRAVVSDVTVRHQQRCCTRPVLETLPNQILSMPSSVKSESLSRSSLANRFRHSPKHYGQWTLSEQVKRHVLIATTLLRLLVDLYSIL